MINFFKKRIKMSTEKIAQYEQLRFDAENECQAMAMSCGLFNPRFLAKIKRSKADKSYLN